VAGVVAIEAGDGGVPVRGHVVTRECTQTLAHRLVRGYAHEHLIRGEQFEEILSGRSPDGDPALGNEDAVERVEGAEDAVPACDVPFSLELLANGL